MPDNSKNDWLVASISKPDLTLGDFEQLGLTPDNTQLLNEKDYKKNEQIQKLFTNPATGTFDDAQFKQHYDVAAQTYNDFAKKEYDTTLLNNNYFFQENFHAPKDAKRFKDTINIGKVKNPFNQISGIEGFTTKTDSGLSVREIAQTQMIQDHLTSKDLDYTPNESGFFGTLYKPTAVLAQWDVDGEHYDEDLGKKVKHQKGDFKYNDNGKPFYETLGNREIYGKQTLSGWDVLTEDGSAANKWDFMDDDSKTKTLTGTIAKTLAHVVPMFIPGVGQWYTGLTLGHALMTDLLPVLAKSTAGLFLNEDLKDTSIYKISNELQGFGAKFKGSVSDEGKMSTFNKENIFSMAGDVFGQLAQQRLIAKIPLWLGQSAKEAKAFEVAAAKYGEEGLQDIQKALKSFKGSNALQQRADYLRQSYAGDEGIAKILNNYDKWSSAGSRSLGVAYMAGISATGVAEEAKLHGLDERDTAAITLGTMAGFGLFMTKFEFAHWALEGMGLDEIGGFMKNTIKSRVRELAPTINRLADSAERQVIGAGARNLEQTITSEIVEAGTEATKKTAREKMIAFFNKGKAIGRSLGESLGDISTVKQKMLAEALEETSEEAMQDALKLTYNGMRALGFTSTDKDESTAFDFKDMASRYMMSAIGGAMGGGIAGVQDKLAGTVHQSLPHDIKREIASAVRHGYASNLQKIVDNWRDDGKLGSKNLSINQYTPSAENMLSEEINYKPMDGSDMMSHNDFVHSMLSAEINLAKDTIFQEGIQSDIRLNDVYNERAETFIDFKLNTGIVQDIDNITNKIIDLKAEIKAVEGGVKDATKAEDSQEKAQTSSKQKEIDDLREELNEIVSGNRALQYTKEALFSVNKALNEPFGIENKDSLAYKEYRKRFEHLNAEEKADISQKYNEYALLEKRHQLRVAHEEFEELNNSDFNQFLPQLADYAKQRQAFLDNYVDLNTSIGILQLKTEEDVDKIDNQQLGALNVGALNMDSGKSGIANLASIVKSEPYLNPVILKYVENSYNTPFKTTDGLSIANVFDNVYANDVDGFLPPEYNPGDVGSYNIKAYTDVDVRDILSKLSPWNFEESVEKLNEVVNHKGFEDMIYDAATREGDSVDGKVVKKAYLDSIKALTDHILSTEVMDGDKISFAPVNETVASIREIKDSFASKPNNPLLDYISQLTKRDGREGLGNLIDIINTTFNDLTDKGIANDFVIDNKITTEQLEYGKNLLSKVAAVIQASTNWEGPTGDTRIIGYNAAANAIAERSRDEEHEVLNTITIDQGVTVLRDLDLLNAKIDFLLNLHRLNSNGSIRELKMTGATMSTLYLNSISPGSYFYKQLDDLGIDMTEIAAKFGIATKFSENMAALESPSDSKITLKSDDDSFHQIRVEKDAIEQALYKAVNSRPDKVDIINKIFKGLNQKVFVNDNSKVNFSSNERAIPKGQELIYLATVLTVDPKQFYKDFVGDLNTGENLIESDPYAPFYGQEHVLKQMYWQMISKLSPVDTKELVNNILLKPNTTLTEAELDLFKLDLQAPTLRNATILYGIPGAGKTTSALYYLTKMAERYGQNVAVFAPHQEQGDRLKESLKDRPNVYNENRAINSLMQSVLGQELYTAMDSDYKSKNIVDYKIGDPVTGISQDSTLMKKINETGAYAIVPNINHPLVSKFLSDKSKIVTYEGKTPSMIVIDEATHLRGAELELLDHAVNIHNTMGREPISLYLVGDREQRGFTLRLNEQLVANNITTMYAVNTPVLSQSLRNRFNIKNKNIYAARALRETIEQAHSRKDFGTIKGLLDTGLTFDYTIDDRYGLVGERLVTEFTKEDLELLFNNAKDTVALITDKESPSLMKLIDSIPGAMSRLKIFNPDNVQGLEYDNIIIDVAANDRKPINLSEMNNTYDALEMFYTMISRSKKGSLIKSPFIRSMSLNSSDEDVIAQKIELAPQSITDYKKFTLDGIAKSFQGLEDLNISPIERTKAPVANTTSGLVATDTNKVFNDEAYKVIDRQLTSVEDINLPIDLAGNSLQIVDNEVRPLTYSFHERFGIEVANGKIIETRTNPIIHNQDLAGLYNIVNNSDLEAGISITDSRLELTRQQLKALKTGIIAHSQKISDKQTNQPLKNFLFNYGVVNNVLSKLDFGKAKLLIETKEFDPKVDLSFAHASEQSKLKGGGLISYLVMEIPRLKDDESVFITMAAFPNTNNPNVVNRKGVMQTMNNIRDNHSRLAVNNVSTFYLKANTTISSVLKPTSNLYIKPISSPESLTDFKNKHSHLRVSEPYVIMNTNIIAQDDDIVQEYFNNFGKTSKNAEGVINGESSSLIGRPVIFVSLDKTIPQNQLADLYIKQLNEQTAQRLSGSTIENAPGTIRMVMLNKKGVSVKDWIAKNVSISNKLTESDIDLKAQRRAYSNNFAAASMLGGLINFKRKVEYFRANAEGESFINKIGLDSTKFSPASANLFIDQVDSIIRTALPILTGKTYADMYVSSGETLNDYIKKHQSSVESFIKDVFDGQSDAKSKAVDHFIASDLLTQMNKHQNDTALQSIKDNDNRDTISSLPNSSLYNFVNSIRLTIAGGVFIDKVGNSSRIDGLFPSAFNKNSIDSSAYDTLLGNLSTLLDYKFPDGIHINPVLRTASAEERYQGDAPFVVPTGNIEDDFKVDIEVQTPTIYFNPETIDFRNPDVVQEEEDSIVEEFKDVKNQVNSIITETIPAIAELAPIIETVVNSVTSSKSLNEESPNEVKDILEGTTVADYANAVTTEIVETISKKIDEMSDNIVNQYGQDIIVTTDPETNFITTQSLLETAQQLANKKLAEIGATEQNVLVTYDTINKPGTTDKVREFTITNAENGEIIGNFVYDNKQFSEVNYLGEVSIDFNPILKAVVGTFVSGYAETLQFMLNSPDFAKTATQQQKIDIGKSYFMVGSYLKVNGFETELSQLREAYNNLIKQTKC